jgi:leucyl-tRNA synthetase
MSSIDATENERRRFDHTDIEPKWQGVWDEEDVFRIPDDAEDPEYVLAMFPYTSGSLHMGHTRNYTITDAYSRFERLRGEDVLHPMGWDSFGLPAENAAEERDTNPREYTMQCIDSMREELVDMGFGYDWDREVTTCEPEYYQWNQWLFTRFLEEDLVTRQAEEVNWCPDCETVLADEQVEGDEEICWRCDTPVVTRELDQWMFTITDYADELLAELEDLEGWPNNVREMQRNWIGRQEGASVEYTVEGYGDVEIFTTRLDTMYGATFFALSPGHDLAQELAAENDEIARYAERAEEAEELPETSGVFTGEYATNPTTGEEIPIYVADYVLEDVGTGALYAVPAHDDRDHAFAEEHDIPITQVVEPAPDAPVDPEDVDVQEAAYTEDGVLVNSGEYDGLTSAEARDQFVEDFDGEHRTEYRLRDWLISRQRYWGTPIPMIECDDCGFVPVPDEDLPVELPEFVHTTGNPLDAAEDWKHVNCPDCGADAVRETDTMDTFVDSSWYFLRYISPDVEDAPFDTELASDWMPVDEYVGGIEHAVMHLLYARFFTKVLDDIDLLDGVREPFTNLTNQGMVLGEDGNKMSKSRDNGVSPTRIIEEYGADTARLFIMEAAQPHKEFAWDPEGVESAHQFLQSVYRLVSEFADGDIDTGTAGSVDDYVADEIDATIATVTTEFKAFRFNHAIQAVRELVSVLHQYVDHTDPSPETLEDGLVAVATLLSPIAPHVCEELWAELDRDGLAATATWPEATMPDSYEISRRLVENTREDIRDIIDVAGIDDPQRIDIAVAPAWKHRVRDLASEADGDVVGTVMQDDDLREHGEAAADYAKDLAGTEHFADVLPPAEEYAALEEAIWLMEREFDADIDIHEAEAAPDNLASKATPARPGISIEE